ncbi:MAG: DNA-3-methyladenine glycosylase 2 [Chloroflexi bacterium]|nr:DNA-3-methyladenine glycosylase 2 [Chloroflexota bacterium]
MLLTLREPLDLATTLDGGQAFRWRRESGWWVGVLGQNAIRLRVLQSDQAVQLKVESAPVPPKALTPLLRQYLALDQNIEAIHSALAATEPALAPALRESLGLRLLRQDPWETLASFILSQNSNIPRITRNIEDLAQLAGEPFEAWGRTLHAFPAPESVANLDESTLGGLRLGYRAPSLNAAARSVADGSLDLEALRLLPYEEAQAALMDLPGVGPKVADCVLAFSLDHGEAFPVDRWVAGAVKRLYPDARWTVKQVAAWGRARFGPAAAYAQQVLFYQERTRPPAERPLPDSRTMRASQAGRASAPPVRAPRPRSSPARPAGRSGGV